MAKNITKHTRRDDAFDEQRTVGRKQTRWYEFVKSNNMILPKRDPSNSDFSHTLLSGGVLNVPVERHRHLLLCLAKDIQDGFLPDFNEIAPPISRLYMDLDFKDKIVDVGVAAVVVKFSSFVTVGNRTADSGGAVDGGGTTNNVWKILKHFVCNT